jgi:SAM-dependent methyltransferase
MLILDAMAGNGNLTCDILRFCCEEDHRVSPLPEIVVFELSTTQINFAQEALAHVPSVLCVHGDILSIQDHCVPGIFDVVMIKSGTHEIPLAFQRKLYSNIFSVLKPGGRFINLGIVYDDTQERDEFRELVRLKDSLAGLTSLVENRHFLLRGEFYSNLRAAGFSSIECARQFHYNVLTSVLAETYFAPEEQSAFALAFQQEQLGCVAMRRNHRFIFSGTDSQMFMPAEITVVRKPQY